MLILCRISAIDLLEASKHNFLWPCLTGQITHLVLSRGWRSVKGSLTSAWPITASHALGVWTICPSESSAWYHQHTENPHKLNITRLLTRLIYSCWLMISTEGSKIWVCIMKYLRWQINKCVFRDGKLTAWADGGKVSFWSCKMSTSVWKICRARCDEAINERNRIMQVEISARLWC